MPIRVILLGDAPDSFGGDVTRTNNLQNRVEARDFVGDDPEQRRLQMEMGMESVDYQFLRGDDFIASPSSCDLVEATTALACASRDPALAVAVKTGIGRFFVDLEKAPYKSIFNKSSSGVRVFNTVLVQRAIDEWIDAKKKLAPKKSGYAWGVLIHGNRILAAGVFCMMETNKLSMPIGEFRKEMDGLQIAEKCEEIYARMVSVLEKKYAGKFLAVLFKNPKMSKDVFELASNLRSSQRPAKTKG